MRKVSKLTIKACKNNKFSSFTGEFIAPINPESLSIKSHIIYHAPISRTTLLKYRHSPPKLLTFSLLLDSTGIIPGNKTTNVMEQIKKLQDVICNVQKPNNAPNYIRIIWGEIDFKGRLIDLDIDYAMYKMDGTLVRAEANLSILEEIPSTRQGKANTKKKKNPIKLYVGVKIKVKNSKKSKSQKKNSNKSSLEKQEFADKPYNRMDIYLDSPQGAYDGGPDHIYQGEMTNNQLWDNKWQNQIKPNADNNSPIRPETNPTNNRLHENRNANNSPIRPETNSTNNRLHEKHTNSKSDQPLKKGEFPKVNTDSLRSITNHIPSKPKLSRWQRFKLVFKIVVKKICKKH